MKRLLDRINIRNLVIVFLCITVIIMAIGFSVLSIELNKDDPFFKVSFTQIEQTSSVKGGTIDPEAKYKINSSGQRVDFNFILNNPYDELMYKVVIKNEGNIPIEIKDIIETPEYNDVTENVLAPEEETEINLVVQFAQGTPQKKSINFSLVLIASSPSN